MKKPKVVEFLGLPNAGKTIHLDKLERTLSDRGLKVRYIQDQIRAAELKDEIEKNLWASREVSNQIAVAREQGWDIILVDRGCWACYASLSAHSKNGKLTRSKKRRKQVQHGIWDAYRSAQAYEDFFILIEISPEAALERDQQLPAAGRSKIITKVFLSALERAYQDVKKRLQSEVAHRMKIVNGENDFQENQATMLKILLSLLGGSHENEQKRKR